MPKKFQKSSKKGNIYLIKPIRLLLYLRYSKKFNGWQNGDAFESDDVIKQDAHDLAVLYKVLLEEILPTYYDNKGKRKVMMKASILGTKDNFGVKRMLEEYYKLLY